MQVKAKDLGYYGMKRRRPGEVFFLEKEKDFSKKWMVKLNKDGSEASLEPSPSAKVEEKSEGPILRKKA